MLPVRELRRVIPRRILSYEQLEFRRLLTIDLPFTGELTGIQIFSQPSSFPVDLEVNDEISGSFEYNPASVNWNPDGLWEGGDPKVEFEVTGGSKPASVLGQYSSTFGSWREEITVYPHGHLSSYTLTSVPAGTMLPSDFTGMRVVIRANRSGLDGLPGSFPTSGWNSVDLLWIITRHYGATAIATFRISFEQGESAPDEFTHATEDDPFRVKLSYNVPAGGAAPFDLEFAGSNAPSNLKFPNVDADTIRNNSALTLQNESPDEALKPGDHHLLINITGTDLESMLLDETVSEIWATMDDEPVTFRGIFQQQPSGPVAVRTGSNNPEHVFATSSRASFNSNAIAANLVAPTSMLIVTGTDDDAITLTGNQDFPPAILWETLEQDEYTFAGPLAGKYRIKETDETNLDAVRFPDFIPTGGGIELDLRSDIEQELSPGFFVTLEGTVESAVGTTQNDIILGTDENNLLDGHHGNDLLVGFDGDLDRLWGGEGNDFIVGDGFELSNSDWAKLARQVVNLSFTKNFSLSVRLNPTAGGMDVIDDGGGQDIVIGGDGDDTITGKGGTVAFGDSFSATGNLQLDLSQLLQGSALSFAVDLQHDGNGNDNITVLGGDNLIVGGDGNDTLTGSGAGSDVGIFFGNGGSDSITALGPINVVVGGTNGSGTESLRGGSGTDFIFGDSIELNTGGRVTFPQVGSFTAQQAVAALTGLVSKLTLVDTGNDKIETGNGINFVAAGGGDDTVDGGANMDVLFGNDGKDTIRGGDGFNFIMGGAGNDPQLKGGSNSDIIIGDSLKITGSVQTFDPDASILQSATGYIQHLSGLFKGGQSQDQTAFGLKLVDSGNDKIELGDGLNLAFGGAGKDTIQGGDHGDILLGGDSNDKLYGYDGTDLLIGGAGNDEIEGGLTDTAPNFIFGDSVSVKLGGSFDVTNLMGSLGSLALPSFEIDLYDSGADTITGADGLDFIVGGLGKDIVQGLNGFNIAFTDDFDVGPGGKLISLLADVVNPLKSATLTAAEIAKDLIIDLFYDIFRGAEGNDPLENLDVYDGGNDQDIVFGGDGPDHLFGGEGFDFLLGGAGNDYVHPGDNMGVPGTILPLEKLAFDNIGYGGPGDDIFQGGLHNDLLFSDEGTDTFYGGPGNDILSGGPGVDHLFGEEGDDLLIDEEGDNFNDGGSGRDTLAGSLPNANSTGIEDLTLLSTPEGMTVTPQLALSLVGSEGQLHIVQDASSSIRYSNEWQYSGRRTIDGVTVHVLATPEIEIHVQNDLLSNPLQPADVNGDGTVSADDAILVLQQVIRQIRAGEGATVEVNPDADISTPLFDVNGDNKISPVDVQWVVQQLHEPHGDKSEWVDLRKLLAELRKLLGR